MSSYLIGFLSDGLWSWPMVILLFGVGIVFLARLDFFPFTHPREMTKQIFSDRSSDAGASPFVSFMVTMAGRIGAGNIAGVAIAIYRGGPGALFWMWIITLTNAAISFAECSLGQLYKKKKDGVYRCTAFGCMERGLGWTRYAAVFAAVFLAATSLGLPAAASFTISNGFRYALDAPMWVISLIIAAVFALTVAFEEKKNGDMQAKVVPFMCVAYIMAALLVMLVNAEKIPSMLVLIVRSAFGRGAVMGGVEGGMLAALMQGVRRATYSSASGMGEALIPSSRAEVGHPAQQGLADAAGVFFDTLVVCTATGFMILLTGSYNTAPEIGGWQSGVTAVRRLDTVGVGYVEEAARGAFGDLAPLFIACMLLLFSFTSLVQYFYEAQEASRYLLRKEASRQRVSRILRTVMTVVIFVWGISDYRVAWDASDLALGVCIVMNLAALIAMFPRVRALYRDYRRQVQQGSEPVYDPLEGSPQFPGVDDALWHEISEDFRQKSQETPDPKSS